MTTAAAAARAGSPTGSGSDRKSEPGSANRRCIASAASLASAGRSRGSWIASAAVMISTSRTHPLRPACRIIRPSRGSTGSSASLRPVSVSRVVTPPRPPGEIAPSSSSRRRPSATLRESGGSTNGKSAITPRSSAAIRRMTDARLVRRISGSVNSGRESKSSSLYRRMQMPSEVRPQRPLRWLAEACEIASIGSRCTLVRWLYREIRAVPGSITYLMPGTVSDVSATLVASTTRRPRCG